MMKKSSAKVLFYENMVLSNVKFLWRKQQSLSVSPHNVCAYFSAATKTYFPFSNPFVVTEDGEIIWDIPSDIVMPELCKCTVCYFSTHS